jgi:pyruvate dehydrogenase E2 component (dihydrolipoamide acetyltransferase)
MPVITMPKLSDTMVEGTIARWIKKAGDEVETGDIIAEVETDKATMEMEAFDDGVLKEIYVQDGGTAKVGEKIALVIGEDDDEESAAAEAKKSDLTTKKEPAEKEASPKAKSGKGKQEPAPKEEAGKEAGPSGGRIKASPLARKIAAERGVSLAGVSGTGPGGRIVAADVPEEGSRPASSAQASQVSAPRIPVVPPGEGDTRIPLSAMRRVIGERLLASKTQIPHFYLSCEMDASALVRVRRELNSANEASGGSKLTVNDFILLAVSRAAAAHPAVNAAWAGDGIIQYAGIHLAVAVAVEDGLVTPVIRDAQKLGLREISAAVKDLAGRARSKKLKPEEFQGGTMTVSNLGSYGIEQFYAIVNPPQAVILAVGAIVKKPVVAADGSIVARERMAITLSGDHRVVDGAVGAEFIVALRRLIENPALMLF